MKKLEEQKETLVPVERVVDIAVEPNVDKKPKKTFKEMLREALPAFIYELLAQKKRDFKEKVAAHGGGYKGWTKAAFFEGREATIEYFKIEEESEFKSDGLKDFVTDADHYILHQKPLRGMLIIRMVLLTFLLFMLWAALTNVEELVKGDGKVVPSSQLQILQSLDGGIVQNIYVKEGQKVRSGQALVQIDSTRFLSSVKENQVQNIALAAKAERLNAQLENRTFKVPINITEEMRLVFAQEQRYFENARYELDAQLSIARQQLTQRRQELNEAQAKRDQAKLLLESASHELTITKPLLGTGAVSEVDLLRLERDVTRYSGERAQAIAQISRIDAAINEANSKIQNVELEFRNNLRKDLSETMAKLNAMTESSVGLQDKLKQSILRAPMNGYVKRLLVNTVGGVITPGKDIVEVVPSEDNLILEVKVPTRDIAFLRVGQKALVKFTAYDFSIYGGMEAKLESIGADSITDEKNNTFYVVKVRTSRSKFSDTLPIIPGMQAEVDISTGKKTVLAYLLKPLLRAKQIALTER
ncbi:AcrA Membrane-fusion protein [Methylophilaceae bacterium]